MCSYNQVCLTTLFRVFLLTTLQINNSYGCQNSYTLNYLLKNELDFQGFGTKFSLSRSF
jgi:beta-glucosidase-like glycosyl hydrolase